MRARSTPTDPTRRVLTLPGSRGLVPLCTGLAVAVVVLVVVQWTLLARVVSTIVAQAATPAALLPLLAGIGLRELDGFLVIRFLVAILALIVAWFAIQARHWWWAPVMAAVAVVWNPVFPLPLDGDLWLGAQYVAALAFILAGVLIKAPNPDRR